MSNRACPKCGSYRIKSERRIVFVCADCGSNYRKSTSRPNHSAAEIKSWHEMAKSGMTVREIHEQTNISKSTLYKHLRYGAGKNLKRRGPKMKCTPEQKAKLLELSSEGKYIGDISCEMNISHDTVLRWLTFYDMPINRRRRGRPAHWTPRHDAKLLAYLEEGLDWEKIGARMMRQPDTIKRRYEEIKNAA